MDWYVTSYLIHEFSIIINALHVIPAPQPSIENHLGTGPRALRIVDVRKSLSTLKSHILVLAILV